MLTPLMLVALLSPVAQTRLVIGTTEPPAAVHPTLYRMQPHSTRRAMLPAVEDLRTTQHAALVDELLYVTDGIQVERLPGALVVDVPASISKEEIVQKIIEANLSEVQWVEEDVFFPVELRATTPNDPLYAKQWALHATDLSAQGTSMAVDSAWDTTLGLTEGTKAPVKVAVIDDGFDLLHPDLSNQFEPGYDVSSNPYDSDPTAGPRDLHGTQTAGVIAAKSNNALGIAGVCPACKVVPVRLFGNGGPDDLFTSGSAAAAALVWAVDQQAAVINNSWGPPDGDRFDRYSPSELWTVPQVVSDAIGYAVTQGRAGKGTLVVWSAGNGAELATYDRFVSDPRVLAIGSVDARGHLAYYSDFGPTVALVTPSSGYLSMPRIATTDLQGPTGAHSSDYTEDFGGTSASAAMASGVAALVVAKYPHLTVAQVREALLLSAVKIDAARGNYVDGRSYYYGYGRIHAQAALMLGATYSSTSNCTFKLELCGNGIDDNCDGVADSNDPTCASCVPDAQFQTEQCDARDNNCDGQNNEGFVCTQTNRPSCAPCARASQCAPDAICGTSPDFAGRFCFRSCSENTQCPDGFYCYFSSRCVPIVSDTVIDCSDLHRCTDTERCDTIDNDCNGIVDDVTEVDADAAERCAGPGVCANRSAECVDGAWQCTSVAHYEDDETSCDKRDNDCDGKTDEPKSCKKRGCAATDVSLLSGLLIALSVVRRFKLALSKGRSI